MHFSLIPLVAILLPLLSQEKDALRFGGWSDFKVGSWVKYYTQSDGKPQYYEYKLLEIGADHVVLSYATDDWEPGADLIRTERGTVNLLKAADKEILKVDKEGEEELQFGGKKFRCRWIEGVGSGKLRTRYWLSKELPGGLAKVEIYLANGMVQSRLELETWEAKK